MLDAGHGGIDKGAHNGQERESRLTLSIAQRVKSLLAKDPAFKVSMSRRTDIEVPLSQRVHLAHQKKAELFVSIHINSSIHQKAEGLEIYYQNQLSPDEDSQFLANRENLEKHSYSSQWAPPFVPKNSSADVKSILTDLHRSYRLMKSFELSRAIYLKWTATPKTTHHQIYQAPFYVLTQTRIPAVLLELGFISNPKELKRLQNPRYQNKLAHSIYRGLKFYKEKQKI